MSEKFHIWPKDKFVKGLYGVDCSGRLEHERTLRLSVGGMRIVVSSYHTAVNGREVEVPLWVRDAGDVFVLQWLKREVLSGRLGKHDPATAIRSN